MTAVSFSCAFMLYLLAVIALWGDCAEGFLTPPSIDSPRRPSLLRAAPSRLKENVDGVLYVNDKCINCSACSHFAPNVFERSPTDRYHVVHHQPDSPRQVDDARAALAACPVAAIRVESQAAQRQHKNQESLTDDQRELAESLALSPKLNHLPLPFPRPTVVPGIYFVGHHNDKSFGATPYLTQVQVTAQQQDDDDDDNDNGSTSGSSSGALDNVWIMVDSPRYSKLSKDAITSLTGPKGPTYLFLTHVDDTAGHEDWKREFPSLKRIFHAGDLGKHNWIGDESLNHVEILLPAVNQHQQSQQDGAPLTMYSLDGTVLEDGDAAKEHNVVILHTPGHSPGSITLYQRPQSLVRPGVIFTGDTYGYTTRTNSMTAFSQYGNDLSKQATVLKKLLSHDWDVVLPGHGHYMDYSHVEDKEQAKQEDVEQVIEQMKQSRKW